jgi:hypothetical protein
MGTLVCRVVPVASATLLAGLLVLWLPGRPEARPGAGPAASPATNSRASVISQKAESTAVARETPEKGDAGGPMNVFADIERGWNARNVDLILRHFGSQKVAISVDGTGPSGGNFSRNQSYYLLKDLFRYTITRKFEFTQFRKPGDEGGQSFAIAERQYQKTDDGRLFKDKVYVSLHLEENDDGQRWVVDEIKSIR